MQLFANQCTCKKMTFDKDLEFFSFKWMDFGLCGAGKKMEGVVSNCS
jgi:hypothetical protein